MIEVKTLCHICGNREFCTSIGSIEECDSCSKLMARFGGNIEKAKSKAHHQSKKSLHGKEHKNEGKAAYRAFQSQHR